MSISLVELNTLKKHHKNVRVHSEENIRAIADSLINFGQQSPLIINENNEILKGNGTYDAMVLLGWQKCEVKFSNPLSPEDELAYLIADNKSSDMSEFNYEQVTDVLKTLEEKGTDLIKTGFREFESKPLLDTNWNSGDDETPPGPVPTNELKIKFTGGIADKVRKIIEYASNKHDKELNDDELIFVILSDWIRRAKSLEISKDIKRRSKPE